MSKVSLLKVENVRFSLNKVKIKEFQSDNYGSDSKKRNDTEKIFFKGKY